MIYWQKMGSILSFYLFKPDNFKDQLMKENLHKFNPDYFLFSISSQVRLLGFALLILIAGLITVSSSLTYNVVVKGRSVIRPVGGIKVVESRKAGIIKSIAVSKNQRVKKGDIIAILELNELEISKNKLIKNINQKQQKIAQIDSQIELINQQIISESQSFDQELLIAEMQLNQVKLDSEKQKIAAQANLQEIEAELFLAENETKAYQNLFEQGVISELEVKEKQAAFIRVQSRLIKAKSELNTGGFNQKIAETRIVQLTSQRNTQLTNLNQQQESLLRERLEIETNLIEEEKNLEQLAIELEKSTIKASANGRIIELHLSNEQQFVNANDVIAEIMPDDVNLVINSLVSNRDIDKVNIGQSARLQINACPYQEFGLLPGKVTQISPDVVSDDKINTTNSMANNNYFQVTIQPERLSLNDGKRECVIRPGMEAQANIISRKETFLQFIFRKTRLFS